MPVKRENKMYYSIKETVKALKEGKVTSFQLVQNSITAFQEDCKSAKPLNAFLEIYDNALELAKKADEQIQQAISQNRSDSC